MSLLWHHVMCRVPVQHPRAENDSYYFFFNRYRYLLELPNKRTQNSDSDCTSPYAALCRKYVSREPTVIIQYWTYEQNRYFLYNKGFRLLCVRNLGPCVLLSPSVELFTTEASSHHADLSEHWRSEDNKESAACRNQIKIPPAAI
jgi:hypothetical protein